MKIQVRFLVCAALCSACGGTRGGYEGTTRAVGDAAVDFATTYQHISGFGASSAWTLAAATDSLADQFFSTETGIGLSLLRVRINPLGGTDELVTAQKAVARGAQVWAAPWSPPGEWKTGTDSTNALWGGKLLPERRNEWAQKLAAFAVSMRDAGAPLLAISAQNEPNWTAKWETCIWTPAELTAFVRDDLGPALADAGVGTPILAPETNDWTSFASFATPLLEDAQAKAFVGPVATHSYGGRGFELLSAKNHDKEVWETEVSDDASVADPGMDSALRVASMIHEHLTVAQVNAWHYWWLWPVSNSGNGALALSGQLTRRAYVLGNFSRFVRPGFVRTRANPTPQRLVQLTAFTDPATQRAVIVAINSDVNEKSQGFVLSNTSASAFTPYFTSPTQALEAGEPIAVADAYFTATLPARSVTTFVSND